MSFFSDFMNAIDPDTIDQTVAKFQENITNTLDSVEGHVSKVEGLVSEHLDSSTQKVNQVIDTVNDKLPN